MSGIEVAALVAGIIGAGAGAVSAGRDVNGRAFHQRIEQKRPGETVSIDKWVMSYGNGEAGVDKKGCLYAKSYGNGSAGAGYSLFKK